MSAKRHWPRIVRAPPNSSILNLRDRERSCSIETDHARPRAHRGPRPSSRPVCSSRFTATARAPSDALDEVAPDSGRRRLARRVRCRRCNRVLRARPATKVIGSWMTRQDRELAIADNVAYVDRAVAGASATPVAARSSSPDSRRASAMAYRAALRRTRIAPRAFDRAWRRHPARTARRPRDAIAWPRVLIGVGDAETWYTPAKVDADDAFLVARSNVRARVVAFRGGHDWTDEFSATRAGTHG